MRDAPPGLRGLWCGVAVSAGIMLRPDGGILLVAVGLFLLWRMWRRPAQRARLFWAGALVLAIAIAPLVPWTLRNWRDFHRFEPLAPRYANDPDEFVPSGYDKWVRTWIADFVSTDEIYWNIPGDPIDLHLLPSRAFDSAEQREKTEAIFRDYNKIGFVNPDLNARFGELANERIRQHPLRYYVGLPMFRIADMWVRPRTEMLPLTSRWWEYWEDPHDFIGRADLGCAESVVPAAGGDGSRARSASAIPGADAALRAAALSVSRHAGKSRAALHAGMLSGGVCAGRGVDSGVEEVSYVKSARGVTSYGACCLAEGQLNWRRFGATSIRIDRPGLREKCFYNVVNTRDRHTIVPFSRSKRKFSLT